MSYPPLFVPKMSPMPFPDDPQAATNSSATAAAAKTFAVLIVVLLTHSFEQETCPSAVASYALSAALRPSRASVASSVVSRLKPWVLCGGGGPISRHGLRRGDLHPD